MSTRCRKTCTGTSTKLWHHNSFLAGRDGGFIKFLSKDVDGTIKIKGIIRRCWYWQIECCLCCELSISSAMSFISTFVVLSLVPSCHVVKMIRAIGRGIWFKNITLPLVHMPNMVIAFHTVRTGARSVGIFRHHKGSKCVAVVICACSITPVVVPDSTVWHVHADPGCTCQHAVPVVGTATSRHQPRPADHHCRRRRGRDSDQGT